MGSSDFFKWVFSLHPISIIFRMEYLLEKQWTHVPASLQNWCGRFNFRGLCVILVGHCRYGEARYSYVSTPRKWMWSEKQAFLFEPQAEPEPRVLRASVMLRGPLVRSQVAEVGEWLWFWSQNTGVCIPPFPACFVKDWSHRRHLWFLAGQQPLAQGLIGWGCL